MYKGDCYDAELARELSRIRERVCAQVEQRIDRRVIEELDANLLYGDRDRTLLPDLRASLDQVGQTWQVRDQPFTSRIPLIGRLIVLFRELWNRVSTKWYVLPILHQQVTFNQAVYRCLGQLYEYLSTSTLGLVRRMDLFFQVLEEKQLALATRWEELLDNLSHQASLISEAREAIVNLQQKDQTQAVASLGNELAQTREALASLHKDQIQAIAALGNDLAQTREALISLQRDQVQWKAEVIQGMEQGRNSLLHYVEQLRGEIQQLERKVIALGEREEENRRGYALQRIWLERLLAERTEASAENRPAPERITPLDWMSPLDAHDYFVFENAFRGSSAEVRRKQETYLPLFTDGGPVVDIGCGRGEFLELLREHNIPAYGIEINEQMVLICREKGLDVRQEEAFAHLDSLPNGSLGGIFLSHVIEHLPIARLSEFARLAFQKLRPGAYLVAETPNPTCLWTFARPFYLDMSHTRPLHPEALSFLFEMAGFSVEVRYLNPVPEQERLVTSPPEGESTKSPVDQAIWQNFCRLNDLIYGYQDYALIARK